MVLPFIKEGVRSLWTKEFRHRLLNAQKDTVYRSLNHCEFNWRKLLALLVNRVLAIVDQPARYMIAFSSSMIPCFPRPVKTSSERFCG